MAQIEVIPQKDGTWRVSDQDGEFENRRAAIDAAYEAAGVEPLFDREGNQRSRTDPHTSVVLLKLDGSMHGELLAAPATPGQEQQVSVTPAGEGSEARDG